MRVWVAAAVAAVLAYGSLAKAADLMRAPPAPPRAAAVAPGLPDWAGPYLGLHAGYMSAGGELTFPGSDEFHFLDPKGFVGGALAGYSKQAGRLVYGIEGDVAFVSAKKTIDIGFAPTPSDSQLKTKITWNGHVRSRVGYAFDRVMPFVAGGLAVAGVDNKAVDNVAGATATWSGTRVGWSLGGGIDYALMSRAVLRFEYLYDNFGTQSLGAQTAGAVAFSDRDHKLDSHTLRGAVSWRF